MENKENIEELEMLDEVSNENKEVLEEVVKEEKPIFEDDKVVNQESLVFSDDVENVEKVVESGETNKLAIAALVCSVLSGILGFIPTDAAFVGLLYFVLLIATIVLSIMSFSQIKKKNQKGKIFAILALVGLFLAFVLSFVIGIIQIGNMSEEERNDLIYCPYVGDCVDNKDGTSTCVYVDDSEVKCTTELLKEDQFK